jgi:hypothetical protein
MSTLLMLHGRVMEIHEALYTVARHGAAPAAGLKCALSCAEICNDAMAEPFRRFRDAERRLIRERLAELNLSPALTARAMHV